MFTSWHFPQDAEGSTSFGPKPVKRLQEKTSVSKPGIAKRHSIPKLDREAIQKLVDAKCILAAYNREGSNTPSAPVTHQNERLQEKNSVSKPGTAKLHFIPELNQIKAILETYHHERSNTPSALVTHQNSNRKLDREAIKKLTDAKCIIETYNRERSNTPSAPVTHQNEKLQEKNSVSKPGTAKPHSIPEMNSEAIKAILETYDRERSNTPSASVTHQHKGLQEKNSISKPGTAKLHSITELDREAIKKHILETYDRERSNTPSAPIKHQNEELQEKNSVSKPGTAKLHSIPEMNSEAIKAILETYDRERSNTPSASVTHQNKGLQEKNSISKPGTAKLHSITELDREAIKKHILETYDRERSNTPSAPIKHQNEELQEKNSVSKPGTAKLHFIPELNSEAIKAILEPYDRERSNTPSASVTHQNKRRQEKNSISKPGTAKVHSIPELDREAIKKRILETYDRERSNTSSDLIHKNKRSKVNNFVPKPGKAKLNSIPELDRETIKELMDAKCILETYDRERSNTPPTPVEHKNVKQLLGLYLIMGTKKTFVSWIQDVTGAGKTEAKKVAKYLGQIEKAYLD